ncbi:putative N6-adenosine-methyltransferase MT-A70-like [Acorus calamus]|uniref:N6-adenosine-methyltransferase MT-A70-like n=1 Tax=Acorus calamus TaxID=4465 RepID=A0AAV9DQY3_ACOCL|nr:putative N6-adenosine-methyltransferase MT-A70-like [Acorus calamus]
MESQSDGVEDIAALVEARQQLLDRIEGRRIAQQDLISTLQTLVPDLVSSLDLSLQLISAFNRRPFIPTPNPNPNPNPNPKRKRSPSRLPQQQTLPNSKPYNPLEPSRRSEGAGDKPPQSDGDRLSVVRTLVAVALLERVPFSVVDAAWIARKLDADSSVTDAERSALVKLGRDSGPAVAVEAALRAIAADTAAIELEELVLGGKSRLTVVRIDRHRLLKELPETPQNPLLAGPDTKPANEGPTPGTETPRRPDMWPGDPHHMMFPRVVGPRGMMRPVGVVPRATAPLKLGTEEDDIKELESLLNKKTFKELQKSKTGEELLDLIHRPTAKETAVAAKFKTKGGSQLKEYCTALTKEDCRHQLSSYIACEKVHFRRIIAPHTDTNLGDCSFLDTCRHMKTCKYVHYELDPTPDVPMMMGGMTPPKPIKTQRAEYCSEVELGEPQWINCDIRSFRMDILGQFGVIMADPPWDIHMELPYGTMADDEMRTLNVPALQTDGLIFLWVTGRAMELGRECLELWGYKRIEEIIWVKTNQLQRIIRTGRTGHWLNHSKEHCLVGIKGNPEVNRNIDTDVIVAEVRETSRKPDEMYPMLERISPRTRKLELFARMHNTHAGWMSLGNQLSGVRLVDEGLRARFKAAYPDVEVQPSSPPRSTTPMDVDSHSTQARSPLVGRESAPPENYPSEEKPMAADAEMVG